MTSSSVQGSRVIENRVSAAAQMIDTEPEENQVQSRNVSYKTELNS